MSAKPFAILGCPFCGQPPRVRLVHKAYRARFIQCITDWCPVSPRVQGTTRKQAVAAWNYRTQPAQYYAIKETPL